MSRSGLSENELLDLLPGLTWSYLGLFCYSLHEHLILKYQGGLLMFAHEQVLFLNQPSLDVTYVYKINRNIDMEKN